VARFLFIGRAPRNRTARATAELVRIEREKARTARAIAKGEAAAAPRAAQVATAQAVLAECQAAIADLSARRGAGETVDAGEFAAVHAKLNEVVARVKP
jgi:hypothetical protein